MGLLVGLGFRLPSFLLPAVWAALIVPMWFVNRITVGRMDRGMPPQSTPLFRVGITIVLAGCAALAATLWIFQGPIDAVRSARDPIAWDRQTKAITAERAPYAEVLERALPVVEKDPQVSWLRRQLDTTEADLRQAKKDVICEQDGTCGTHVPGEAKAYDDKVVYRDELAAEVTRLEKRIDGERRRVRDDIAALKEMQKDASGQLRILDARLEVLGSTPPDQPSHLSAMVTVGERRALPMGAVSIGAFLAVLVIDWLALNAIVRRICRRPDSLYGESISEKVGRQSEKQQKNAHGIEDATEMDPQLRHKFLPGGW